MLGVRCQVLGAGNTGRHRQDVISGWQAGTAPQLFELVTPACDSVLRMMLMGFREALCVSFIDWD